MAPGRHVLVRVHRRAALVWAALAGGAGLGFIARDLAALPQPLVALAWIAGALAGPAPLLSGKRRPGAEGPGGRGLGADGPGARGLGGDERGQAVLEFTALVLLAALALGALAGFGPRVDGRSFGGFLGHRVVCAVKRGCHDGDGLLARAYGDREATLVREHAPNLVYEPGERSLPVDWRRCRRPACAEAPDERGLDVHRSDSGQRATVFTRVIRRDGRIYLQYWLYYPDSKTAWAGSDRAWEAAWLIPQLRAIVRDPPGYPGFHRDDWEAYLVRLDPDGSAWARASSHGHWQGCKEGSCRNEWVSRTGWTRVSRGSHAGHIPMRSELSVRPQRSAPRWTPRPGAWRVRLRRTPMLPGHDLDERTTTGEGLRLIPLETHDRGGYRRHADDVAPPWEKDAYRDPESGES